MKAFFRGKMESVRDDYLKDLDAMPHAQLAAKPGGAARSGYDFSYEVILVNRRVAARLQGKEPPPWEGGPEDGWTYAPEAWQDKERIKSEFLASMDEILRAWNELTDEQIADMSGDRSPVAMAYFACLHPAYHDAQLNYLQAMNGDSELHWE